MKQPLSEKQYITTKARSLPIAFCSVNAEWRDTGLAHVRVVRRHVTGNITGAIFMVDLYCLGVKDVYCFFNEDPDFLDDRFEDFLISFVEIDYNLAHNIVYAGHDYAMEFDIHPHKDFAIARYILEEDDERVPLMDVETGYMGKPLLQERFAGEYREARAKLEKHLGPDGYNAVVREDLPDDDDEYDDDEYEDDDEAADFEEVIDIDDIPPGHLSPYDIARMEYEVLTDDNIIRSREPFEQTLMLIETMLRLVEEEYDDLDTEIPELGIDLQARAQVNRIREDVEASYAFRQNYPAGITEEQYVTEMELFTGVMDQIQNEPELTSVLLQQYFVLPEHADQPLYLCHVALISLVEQEPESFLPLVLDLLQHHRHVHLVSMLQTCLLQVFPSLSGQPWCSAEDKVTPSECFPGRTTFSDSERSLFYTIKTIQYARQNQLLAMTASYRAMAEANAVFPGIAIMAHLALEVMRAHQLLLQERIDRNAGAGQ